ncbi:MAG: SH3 domain-containing protein [Saprospiraceae bacterium]
MKQTGSLSFFVAFAFLSIQILPAQQYVWASSNLNLRKTPDFKGEILAELPYGTPIEFLSYAQMEKGFSEIGGDYEEPVRVKLDLWDYSPNMDPYNLWGSWIRTKHLGIEGFLFDGYLSGMPPNVLPIEKEGEFPTVAEGMKALHNYYVQKHGALLDDDTATIFGDGTFLKHGNKKFEETTWVFPHLSEHDGFLLLDYFLNLQKKSHTENAEWFKYSGFDRSSGLVRLSFFYQGFSNMVLDIFFCRNMMIVVSEWGGD